MKRLKSSLLMLVLGVLMLPMLCGTKVKAATVVREGIDVSGYSNYTVNGWKDTDWDKVKASGKKFVFIRCGYTYYDKVNGKYVRNLYADGHYEKNIQGALDAGLDVGVYYVSQAFNTTEARQEADYAMNLVNKVLAKNRSYELRLPFVVDFEDPNGIKDNNYPYKKTQPSKAQFNAICQAFCDRVESKGFTGAFYAGKSHLETKFDQNMLCGKYPFWYARYISKLDKTNVTFWQYERNVKVSGVPEVADLNYQYINTPSQVGRIQANVNNSGKMCVSWSKVPGVYGYQLYRTSSKTNKEELVATVRGAAMTNYQDNKVENGVTYTYRVRAFLKTDNGSKNYYGAFSGKASKKYGYYWVTLQTNGGRVASGNVRTYVYGTRVNLPTNVQRANYLFAGWYTNKQCTSGRTTAITNTMSGNKTYYAKWTRVSVGAPKIKTLKNNSKRQMTVTLQSRVSNADGYWVKYSTNSNMRGAKWKRISRGNTLSTTITGLTKGKTYYVEVYAYRRDSLKKEVPGRLSAKKSVRITK